VTEPQEIVASPAPTGKPPTDWSFARRPGWILSHIFVAACVVTFIFLAFWQLDRLHGRREVNRVIGAREQTEAVPLESLTSATATSGDAADLIYRKVTVTGRYDTDNQVLIRNRTRNKSDPGWWLMTPLVSVDGTTAVAVNRGWVPYAIDEDGALPEYGPPAGIVTVTGLVLSTQNRVSGPYDPADGVLHTLSRVDLNRWQRQLGYDLYPVYVSLQSSNPAQAGDLPEPVPTPDLGDGPHLNYAGQWLIFATLTVIVYPLLLRRRARDKATEKAERAHAAAANHDPSDAPGDAPGDGPADQPVDQPTAAGP
jgi:cytochrome oxidase assembly protein ShyY1